MAEGYWSHSQRRTLSRRRLLARGRSLVVLGAAGWLAAACGSSTGNGSNGRAVATTTGSTVTGTRSAPAAVATARGGSPAAASIKRGGVLVMALGADLNDLDPHTFVSSDHEEPLRAIVEPIVGTDAQSRYAPDRSLSAKWEQVSNTEFVFNLRPGVKFHDGSDLTAEVVQWNFQDILDPSRNSPRKASFSVIDRMEPVDATHLRLVLKQPTAGFFGDLNHPSAGIISRASFDKLGAEGLKSDVVGTGPFKLKAWNRSQSFELDANPQYWDQGADGKPLPYLAGVRWDIIPDDGVRSEALASGKLNILSGLSSAAYDRFSKDKKFTIDSYLGDFAAGLFVNRTVAPFNEPGGQLGNLQAFWITLDRQKVVDVVWNGRGLPAYGGVSPTMHKWAYTDALNLPKGPDLKQAKALLAQAGNPNGFELPVVTLTGAYVDELQVMQSQLAQVGIKLAIQTMDVTTAINKMWTVDKNIPAFYAGYAQTVDPNLKLSIAHGSKGAYCPEPDSYKATSDYFKATDSFLQQGNATYDPAARAAAYKGLQEVNGKYAGLMYVVHRETAAPLAGSVKDFNHGPDNKKQLHAVWLAS